MRSRVGTLLWLAPSIRNDGFHWPGQFGASPVLMLLWRTSSSAWEIVNVHLARVGPRV